MKNTTLCYIERSGQYLMLHRTKKENDLNRDKWVGVGGKFEPNESPDECLLREVREETGLTLTDYHCHGVVTFVSDRWEGEYMYLYTATGFEGKIRECDEGTLEWARDMWSLWLRVCFVYTLVVGGVTAAAALTRKKKDALPRTCG